MNTPTNPSCQDDFYVDSLTPVQARERLLSKVTAVQDTEWITLHRALGRVLATPVLSSIDVPGHINSAMDGYAVCHHDISEGKQNTLRVVGSSFAGKPYTDTLHSGEAVRIMTGALLPAGSDTVIIQEHVQVSDGNIRIDDIPTAGANVRMAGEDVHSGETVLVAGTHLGAAEIGVIASLGIAEICVFRRLRVAFFSTGDELCSIGKPLQSGMIYDSNRYTLYGMLQEIGVSPIDLGVVADQPAQLRSSLQSAATQADVIITSGGVSVGDADYVKEVLTELGDIFFWKVAMKPGRPLTFGKFSHATFFGLPGNPVSVMVTFKQFVQPALQKMMGMHTTLPIYTQAICQDALKKRPGREEYVRGILAYDQEQQLIVHRAGKQGSGILRSMTRANCFILLPMDCSGVDCGDTVVVQPLFNHL